MPYHFPATVSASRHSSAAVSAGQMNPLRSPPQPLPPPLPPSTGTCADIDTAPAAGRARRFASPRRRCRKNNPYYMEKKFGGLKFMPYICTPEIRKDTCNAQVVKLVDTLLWGGSEQLRSCKFESCPGHYQKKKTIDDQSVVFFCLLSCTKEKNRLSQNYTPKLSNMKIAIQNHSRYILFQRYEKIWIRTLIVGSIIFINVKIFLK